MTIKSKKEWEAHKTFILEELARLQDIGWGNDKTDPTIFPYVVLEAINILFNSDIKEDPKDYCGTGDDASSMIQKLLNEKMQYNYINDKTSNTRIYPLYIECPDNKHLAIEYKDSKFLLEGDADIDDAVNVFSQKLFEVTEEMLSKKV